MKTALSIAGSDPSGGAGIQADIKTMTLNGVYAMSVVTAMTAQNTKGVSAILETDADFLGKELDAVFEDIFPDAVKIGMAASKRIIEKTAEKLSFYNAKNIVADPVMIATSGASLIGREAVFALKEKLLPLADLITPNIPEAEALSGTDINNEYDMIKAAEKLSRELGCSVLIKGGHRKDSADDILFCDGRVVFFRGKRIGNPNTHGTGCTLSSAIAANLAKGYPLEKAVERAKEYISGALEAGLDLGSGSGPLNHAFDLNSRFSD
ncbi:MAG: bifunctional hydroxymethylpyrimidine kinase/phosphomethylpyrimidine kinase [Clostridia bacterium]|nr:bifunctional hydroxymethylpyrimidine kinase/phosphomethylpyrimidine kinase [Clostridia bacterium]